MSKRDRSQSPSGDDRGNVVSKMDNGQITEDMERVITPDIQDIPGIEYHRFTGPGYQKKKEEFYQNSSCIILSERICDAHDAEGVHYAFNKGATHYRCNDPNCGCDVCIACFEENKSGCEHPLSGYELTVYN